MPTGDPIPWSFELVAEYAMLGLFVGVAYYLAYRMNIGLPLAKDQRWLLLVLNGMRIAAAIAFFAWLASLGVVPVLSAFAGFLLGRALAFRLIGENA
jgi:N-ATPase, AtpR subunit